MGSGETTTGMLGVHREVFSGLPDPTDARLMDSPFAFQENADELVEKINQYFTESLGHPLRAITLPASADALTVERALADIRAADWVFAGPGSPSYARRCWEGTGVPEALAGVVAPGRSGLAGVRVRGGGHPRGLGAARVRDLQGRRGPPLGARDRPDEPDPGLALRGHPALRQPRGRHARHPLLLRRRSAAGPDRARPRRRVHPRCRRAHRTGPGPRCRHRVGGGPQRGDAAGGRCRGRGPQRRAPDDRRARGPDRRPRSRLRLWARGTGRIGRRSARRSAGASLDVARPASSAGSGADAASEADLDLSTDRADARDAADLARTILAALPDSATDERAAVVALVHQAESASATHDRELAGRAVQALVDLRSDSRAAGDWAASDRLRDVLAGVGVRGA